MKLADIYFILFRHKWKVVICAFLGLFTAIAVTKFFPAPYISKAKLLIRYVQDKQAPTLDEEAGFRRPDRWGETIMRTEVEILNSFDLAKRVAIEFGTDRILRSQPVQGDVVEAAARVIREGTTVAAQSRNSVIDVSFEHGSADLVEPILAEIVDAYLKRHAEVHKNIGLFNEALAKETDELRARLNQTEEELREIKGRAGVISVEEAKRVFSQQIAKLQESIMDAESDFAGQQASLASNTGRATTSSASSESEPVEISIPDEKASAYRQVTEQLEILYRRERELLQEFTAETSMVKRVRAQIVENENIRARLEREHPSINSSRPIPAPVAGSPMPAAPAFDAIAAIAQIRSTESRIKVMTEQLASVRKDVADLSNLETTIAELERRKSLQEQHYISFSAKFEEAQIDDKLGSGKVSNIGVIEAPTPAELNNQLIKKTAAGLALFGVVLGLALAFVTELFLDHSVRRPHEVEAGLGLPLVLSFPKMKSKQPSPLIKGSDRPALMSANGANGSRDGALSSAHGQSSRPLVPWSVDHELRTFFDALRNRLVYSFEMRGITRKPKLVAVTSCGKRSGVSTIAAGLAASLSETGDGNVLLVDMNPDRKTPQFFHRGDLKPTLTEVLEVEKRDDAMVSQNLYVVSQDSGEDRLSWVMPRRFATLVPKLKASDFDYIIFDMPPVSQISATPQLTRFMDQVLMVVEAETTNRDTAKRAGAMLAEAGANVGIILNKTRSHVPAMLDSEASTAS